MLSIKTGKRIKSLIRGIYRTKLTTTSFGRSNSQVDTLASPVEPAPCPTFTDLPWLYHV